jgi:hypothetical protein
MATVKQPKIDKQYRGNYFIAITRCEKMYNTMCGFSKQGLTEHLESSERVHGAGFQTVQTYEGVSCSAVARIEKAARELEAGKKPDLEKVLE